MDAIDLVNASLREIGGKAISAISDSTPAGAIAGDIYEIKRDLLLYAHTWNFATIRAQLGRSVRVPIFEWDYAYELPSDWLRTVSVHDNNSGSGTVPYKMESVNNTNRLTQSTFDTQGNWSGTNWTFSDGKATHTTGSTSALTQTATLTASTLFRVEYEISGMSAGTLTPTFSGGTGVSGTAVSEDGFYAEEITAHSGGNTSFNLVPTSAFDGSVDNVYVRQMSGDNWINVILTDAAEIYLRYIRRVTDVDLMTYGFRQALIHLMAKTFAAGPAASNTLRELSNEDLRQALRIARSIDGIEDMVDQVPEGSWVTSRGSSGAWKRGSVWPAAN